MSGENTEGATDDAGASWRALIIGGTLLAAFFAFLECVDWYSERGGLMSTIAALRAASVRASDIDVDHAGLRFPILLICILVSLATCGAAKIDISKRGPAVVFALFAVLSGFVIDVLIDEPIVGHVMATHGYTRCPIADHDVGTGKGKVWFDNYTLSYARCFYRS